MAKTYNTFTNVSTGDVYTAASHNAILQNLAGHRVPSICRVYRATDLTGYTSNTDITWNAEAIDTDSMFAPSSTTITIGTTGLYMVVLHLYWTATATVTIQEGLIYKGATLITSGETGVTSSTAGIIQRTVISSMTAGDTVTARLKMTGGSAYVVKGSATVESALTSSLSVVWLGQVS